jgi:hypothetical protein
MSAIFVFNQYYIDLLKKLKHISKKNKDNSSTAKKVLKAIKDNYVTFDKSSDEYISFIKSNFTDELWDSYINDEDDSWLKNNAEILLYSHVNVNDIVKLLRDNYLCHHFLTVFYIFKDEKTEDELKNLIKILQTNDNTDTINELENENYKKLLLKLNSLKGEDARDKASDHLNTLKDTTIGKIAKEIMDDIDVDKIKKSISDEGDIFKAIANPESGFGELFSSVSQKMASKISNGELSQENVIKDAMKFASVLPGMMGGASGGNNNSGASNLNNMTAMMNMMSMMMNANKGGKGGDDMPDLSALFNKKSSNGTKTAVNQGALKKLAKMKQLQSKLAKRRGED